MVIWTQSNCSRSKYSTDYYYYFKISLALFHNSNSQMTQISLRRLESQTACMKLHIRQHTLNYWFLTFTLIKTVDSFQRLELIVGNIQYHSTGGTPLGWVPLRLYSASVSLHLKLRVAHSLGLFHS